MKHKKCCVTFMTYKSVLTELEEQAFKRCINIFSKKRDIRIIIPSNISTEYYDKFNEKTFEYVKVDPSWMDGIKSYNRMCCNNEFYQLFSVYDYILIYQGDCWVFEDRLDEFMNLEYDYYGAPWPIYNDLVGNGGLSLRKVSKMIELTTKFSYDGRFNEDGWFCLTHKNDMNICDLDTACNFSIEIISSKYFPKIKTIPMGLHSYRMQEFWDEKGEKFMNFKNNLHY